MYVPKLLTPLRNISNKCKWSFLKNVYCGSFAVIPQTLLPLLAMSCLPLVKEIWVFTHVKSACHIFLWGKKTLKCKAKQSTFCNDQWSLRIRTLLKSENGSLCAQIWGLKEHKMFCMEEWTGWTWIGLVLLLYCYSLQGRSDKILKVKVLVILIPLFYRKKCTTFKKNCLWKIYTRLFSWRVLRILDCTVCYVSIHLSSLFFSNGFCVKDSCSFTRLLPYRSLYGTLKLSVHLSSQTL